MPERVYVALDLETTGLDAGRDTIIEIGAVRFQHDQILDTFTTLVNPRRQIPPRITHITGIRNTDVVDAPVLQEVLPELLAFVGNDTSAIIAHNAPFDIGFMRSAGVNFHRPAHDTWELSSILLSGMGSYSLGELSHQLGIKLVDAHRALDDALATAKLYAQLQARAAQMPAEVLQMILDAGANAEWAHLQFFAEALEHSQSRGGAAVSPPLARGPAPALLFADPLERHDEPVQPVSPDVVTAMLGPQGALAREMQETYEDRPGQSEMAVQVLQAFNRSEPLLIEAGTGTGKSLAYLVPSALWSQINGRRVVIATNTIALQDQLLEKDIPQVQRMFAAEGRPVPSAGLLKGRQNYLCTRRLQQWAGSRKLAAQEMAMYARALIWLEHTESGDVNEISLPTPWDRAVWQRICSDASCSPERCLHGPHRDFYWEARLRADHANLLVVNHALLLADIAAEHRVLPGYDVLVVDETHHLEEAATDQFTFRAEWAYASSQIRRLQPEGELLQSLHQAIGAHRLETAAAMLPRLARFANRAGPALSGFSKSLVNFANQQMPGRVDTQYSQRLSLDSTSRSQPAWSQIEIEWDATSAAIRDLSGESGELLRLLDAAQWRQSATTAGVYNDLRTLTDHWDDFTKQLDEIIHTPHGPLRGRVPWVEVSDNGQQVILGSSPLTVAELLEEKLVHRCRSVVFTGATLRTGSGYRFIRERLGLWDVTIASVESPFDYRKSTLLCLPSDMPAPNQPDYQRAVDQAIIDATVAAGGRTLALFTSYQQLRATADTVRPALERQGITVVQHGQGNRQRLLREFRGADRALLLGTRSFWEGVDLPGDELICLLIAKLPFGVPTDPLVAARSSEFDDPFNEYTLPEAVLRFRQGFGRLIRRATDRGVVIVLDNRVWRKEYGQAFLDALPECTVRRTPLPNVSFEVRRWLGTKR
jgi:DNA polymerase-3 subunit epsilon/ATP-dependent DNA helicase DinG